MRGKLLLAFLAGLVVGVVFLAVASRQPQAAAQAVVVRGPQWEYKAVKFTPLDNVATIELNRLAADRWEYVGVISTGVHSDTGGVGAGVRKVDRPTFVAFRRPKR
jgi:hypothetical protein